MDWRGACVVSLCNGKGNKSECSNSRGICLLSVVGKLYGRVFIKRVKGKKVKSSMAKSLTVENILPQNVGSIINYLQ